VTLNVIQYQPSIVTVLGEVASPGRLQLLAPHSLLDIISFVGGETDLAGGEIQVRHEQSGQVTTTSYRYGRNSDGSSISTVPVHNGDTVIVPRAGIIYVLGSVQRPGGYLMQEDGELDTAQALSLASGTIPTADTKNMRIIRRRPDGTFVEFKLNYQDMVHGKVVPPKLQAQDIVYVPMSHLKATLTSGANVIGETASATIYAVR
jgi:polysaccharide export outer membrane protein